MLQALFKKLLIKKNKPVPINKLKPLSLQTLYGQAQVPEEKTSALKSRKTLCLEEQQNLISKRYELLQKDDYFHDTKIEICTLSKYEFLIGLTKHRQTILSGVFMYPEAIRTTYKWTSLEKQASDLNTGIALFATTQPIHCLKVSQTDHEASAIYLIDHRAIERTEWIKHPPTVKE